MEHIAGPHSIRVLLVEDNRLLREGLTGMINEQADVRVVAALEDCDRVIEYVHNLEVDVILLDTSLTHHDMLRVVASIKTDCPDTRVIVVDLLPTQSDVFSFIQAGVSGFLLKDASLDECLDTIRTVARGMNVLPSAMTGSLFSAIFDQTAMREGSAARPAVQLTKREREIVKLIGEGLSNKEIAERLNLATFTVKSHVHNVLEKLALHSRLQVASHYANKES